MTDEPLSYQSKLTNATTYTRTSACNVMGVFGIVYGLAGGCLGVLTIAITRADQWDQQPIDMPATIAAVGFAVMLVVTGLTYLIAGVMVRRRSRLAAEFARVVALINLIAITLFLVYGVVDEMGRHSGTFGGNFVSCIPFILLYCGVIATQIGVARLLTRVLQEP